MPVTLRALIVGFLAAAVVSVMGYVFVPLGLNWLIEHHMPTITFGGLVVFLLTLGPLLAWVGERWRVKPGEIAVVLTIVLAACSVPERGIMRQFHSVLAMPIQMYQLNPGWQKNDLLKYAPREFMPADGTYDSEVIEPYLSGAGRPGHPIGLGDVPWRKWKNPVLAWLPLAFLMSVCSICLAVIVHRQWSQRERLRYPLADVTVMLMSQERGRLFASIFREKSFLIGLGVVVVIHLVNGYHCWNPASLEIPVWIDLSVARQKWPDFFRVEYTQAFSTIRFFPVVVGFAYFLSSEISLSLGLTQIFYSILGYMALRSGIDISTDYMRGGLSAWIRFGGYVAFIIMMIYAGRRYYSDLLGEAFLLRTRGDVNSSEKWSARILLVCFFLAGTLLTFIGLDWPFAFLAIALMLLTFLVAARINAETGLFFVQSRWQAMAVFLGFFGAYSLGPKVLLMAGIAGALLCLDPSQSLLAYVTNSLRICERTGVSVRKGAALAFGGWMWALVIVTPVAFWATYNYGLGGFRDRFPIESVPLMIFRGANSAVTELRIAQELDASVAFQPLERFLHIRPDKAFVWGAGAGFLLVCIAAFLRLRLTWWPIHPVLFLVWATHPMFMFSNSFLLGWLIKALVMRIGGVSSYHRAKPFMIGMIAGDLMGFLIWIVVGAWYRFATGLEPPKYTMVY